VGRDRWSFDDGQPPYRETPDNDRDDHEDRDEDERRFGDILTSVSVVIVVFAVIVLKPGRHVRR
jgi:hypothetical protein